MELRQLKYLVAVAETGSFTRAAEEVRVAQPGISAQVRQLERELGQPLLDRTGRSVTPTPVGEAVLVHARAALAAAASIRQVVDAMSGLLSGHLTIGSVPSLATEQISLADLLAAFHRDHPGIEITLTEGRSDDLAAAVRAGALEIAVVSVGATGACSGIAVRTMAIEPLVAAVPTTHRFAGRTSLPLVELRDAQVLALPRGTGLRARIDAASARIGVDVQVAFEAGDPRVLLGLAERGLGVALVPRSACTAHAADRLVSIPIVDPPIEGHIVLAYSEQRQPSPAATAFLDHVEAALAR